MVSSVAAYDLAMAHTLLCIVSGDDPAVFCFMSLVTLTFDLDLGPFNLGEIFGRDFCTKYLTAKFDHPAFSCSKLSCGQTNKQAHTLTNNSLRYAMPVGNNLQMFCCRPFFVCQVNFENASKMVA